MTFLLDGNVLIALVVADHVHHTAAETWFASHEERFATCPLTQGKLLHWLLGRGARAADAWAVLAGLDGAPRHEFWPDDISYAQVPRDGVAGHRQVMDAYLAALARRHGGQLATFDRGLANLHRGTALIPTTNPPPGSSRRPRRS